MTTVYYIVRGTEPNKFGAYKHLKRTPSYFGHGKTSLAFGFTEEPCHYCEKEDAIYDIELYLSDHPRAKITDFVIAKIEVRKVELEAEKPFGKYIQFNCNAYGWDADNLKSEDIREAIFERYHVKTKTFSYNIITNSFDNHKTVRVLSDSLVLEEE